MLAGAGLLALSTLACLSLAAVNAWMITLMVLRGVGFGLYANATGVYAAQIMPTGERGRWIGINFAANQIAIAISPALAEQTILHLGFRAFFLLSVAFAGAGMALVWGVSPQPPGQAAGWAGPLRVLAEFVRFLLSPATRWVFLTLLMMGCALGAIFTFTATYVRGLGLASGLFFMLYASVNALTRILGGGSSDRYGRAVVIIPALCTFAGGLALYGGARGLLTVLGSALIIGLGFGLANPAVLAQMLDRTPRENHTRAIGAFNLAFQLGTLGASPLFGLVALHWGYPPMWRLAAAAGLAGALIYWVMCVWAERRAGQAAPGA